MPRFIKAYVRYVDAVNRVLGYFVMYLTLVMMGLLLFASVTRYVFNVPFVWIIEMSQFLMAAYYILGGGYSMQLDAHVRMDVLYERWRPRTRAFVDSHHGVLPGLLPGHHDSRRDREQRLLAQVQPDELLGVGAADGPDQDHHDRGHRADAAAGDLDLLQGRREVHREGDRVSYEAIAVLMFSTFMLLLLTGQRVFGAIGFVAAVFALALWGEGAVEMPFASTITLINWYPMLTLPMFIYMGYMLSESGIASDLYRMFHVWTGPMRGGLAVGTILLMVAISAMNGLSVAGMAIGATIAMPELLKRGYDKIMVTGVIQAGSTLGIMIPPSVVLVLYGMIARQPVGQLWLAGVGPGLLLAAMFILYIVIRCHFQPHLGPPLPREEREQITWREKFRLLSAGILPLAIIFSMTGLFVMGVTSMVESSAVGAFAATLVAWYKGRITRKVMEDTLRKSLAVSAMFMWIILAALAFGAVFDGLGAVKAIEVLFLEKWGLEPWQVLVLMQLTYIVMGTFLDDTAMLIIVAPLYVPLVIALGFNPIWYGILYTITCQIAYMTPPFGYNLFLMRAMAPKEVTLVDIYKSIIPFVLIMLVGLALVIIYPEIALWLPNHVYVK